MIPQRVPPSSRDYIRHGCVVIFGLATDDQPCLIYSFTLDIIHRIVTTTSASSTSSDESKYNSSNNHAPSLSAAAAVAATYTNDNTDKDASCISTSIIISMGTACITILI